MSGFTHQYNFNIKIPKEVLSDTRHDEINTNTLEGKIIIGLCGYGKSGKDTIASNFIKDYGFERIAFADNIKKEMNLYLKEAIVKDINERASFVDGPTYEVEKVDFFTEDLELKKVIRPYIIWYGEKLRELNGKYWWVNRAFSEDGKDKQKIVLSDLRREAELEIFRGSNEFNKRYYSNLIEAGASLPEKLPVKNYGTLLFYVNQFMLTDKDTLTHDTIRVATEEWLFDYTFMVDSRIQGEAQRKKSIDLQVKKVANKFGIVKPERIKHKQMNIFQMSGETNLL